jgi:hypothetical protein
MIVHGFLMISWYVLVFPHTVQAVWRQATDTMQRTRRERTRTMQQQMQTVAGLNTINAEQRQPPQTSTFHWIWHRGLYPHANLHHFIIVFLGFVRFRLGLLGSWLEPAEVYIPPGKIVVYRTRSSTIAIDKASKRINPKWVPKHWYHRYKWRF